MPYFTGMATYDQYQLRFPPGLRDRLQEEADKNSQSLHQEIIERLKASFEPNTLENRVATLEAQMKGLLARKR